MEEGRTRYQIMQFKDFYELANGLTTYAGSATVAAPHDKTEKQECTDRPDIGVYKRDIQDTIKGNQTREDNLNHWRIQYTPGLVPDNSNSTHRQQRQVNVSTPQSTTAW